MLPFATAAAAWQPRAPIDWNGATRHGPLFDPMREFSSTTNPSSSTDRPLLLSLPGLDGHPLTAFVQFPALSRDYDVLQWQPDRSNANAGGDHAGLVSEICAYVARESERRDIFLMGESFGGVQALDVALRANEHLAGVIAVNPATSFPRTDLPEIAEEMLAAPAWRFALLSAWLFGTRVGDAQQTRTILKTLVDNPINDPERTPPELAEYLNAAIPAFVQGFATPRDYFLRRLASLGPAAEAVNAALEPRRRRARRHAAPHRRRHRGPPGAQRERERAAALAARRRRLLRASSGGRWPLGHARRPHRPSAGGGGLEIKILASGLSRLSRRPPPPPRSAACRG